MAKGDKLGFYRSKDSKDVTRYGDNFNAEDAQTQRRNYISGDSSEDSNQIRYEVNRDPLPSERSTYPTPASPIDNDYHPMDQGLDATDDHWGSKLSDMVSRGRKGTR